MSLQRLELVVDHELVLRQFAIQDAQAIYDLISASREHLSQNGDRTSAKYPDLASVVASITFPQNPRRLRMGMWNRESVLVGSINLTPEEVQPAAEVGYYLGAEFQGRGYASRAVSRIVRYAFEELGLRSVFAKVTPANAASVGVLERNGFHLSRQEADEKGELINVYSIVRA
jgi:RimJ/RimL family protein N-acetyltransferase